MDVFKHSGKTEMTFDHDQLTVDIAIISQNIKPQSTFRRKPQIFCERVEENNFRPGNTDTGWKIPLLQEPLQEKPPTQTKMDLYKTELVSKEVDTMLEKGDIVKVKSEKG